jgi:hypothetical protein
MQTTTTNISRTLIFLLFIFSVCRSAAQTLMSGMPVPNSSVYSFEKDGPTVYVGGMFTQVNSVPHHGLFRFDGATGTVDSWSADIDNNLVTCLTKAGGKLIAGGSFQELNGQYRPGICMFDLATGNLESWTDTANFFSWRMGIGAEGNLFYYGSLEGGYLVRILCVDASTGSFTSWQSDSLIYGNTNAVFVADGFVYVGGDFSFSGGPSQYDNLCRFNQVTGALDTSWHPHPLIGNFGVTAIVKTSGQIFVGGDFNTIDGQSRKGVAAFYPGGSLAPFNQSSSSYEVLSLYAYGDYIWVGGNSSTLGNQLRYRIAQINISNSISTCWDATATSNTWSTVQALLVSGDTVYAGPFGSPSLSVFSGSPLPLQASAISGHAAVLPFANETYTVPYVPGNTYAWNITGGTGTSTTNTINVSWGAGPNGSIMVIENNPSAFYCSADTSLQVLISANVGLNDPDAGNNISIYPNPSEGNFTVTTSDANQKKISVYDIVGNEFLNFNSSDKLISVDLGEAASGIYFLKIETDAGMFTEKLFKR